MRHPAAALQAPPQQLRCQAALQLAHVPNIVSASAGSLQWRQRGGGCSTLRCTDNFDIIPTYRCRKRLLHQQAWHRERASG